jgi:IS30 family transposase
VNENTNGLIRDFCPKGTDFSTIHPATVAKVERLLNSRPRKSLGFKTPTEVFHALAKRG